MTNTLRPTLSKKSALFAILVLGCLCLQIFRWQDQALGATSLELKSVFRSLSYEEHMRLGVYARGLNQNQLARRHYQEALWLRPESLSARANLAVVSWQLEEIKQAEEHFQNYFSKGGGGHDLMAYYARFLLSQKRNEEAVSWFYRSLMTFTQNQRVANELIDLLMLNESLFESLSLIGALMADEGANSDFWKLKFKPIERRLSDLEKMQEKAPQTFRAPSLDGRRSWIPVRSEVGGSLYFLLLDRSETELTINESDLALWSYESLKKTKSESEAEVFQLAEFWVGPWRLQNLPYKTCKDCQSSLGSVILKDLSAEIEVEGAMSFLRLSAR